MIASHDRELLTQMPRILELASAALRSYGGNYVDYQQQRELEQQAARAALGRRKLCNQVFRQEVIEIGNLHVPLVIWISR